MPLPLIPIIGTVGKLIFDIIDRTIDDPKQKAELQRQATQMLHEEGQARLQGQISIILAEANGKSWLQRNWRPILMLTIVAIIANNYIIAPYLGLFGLPAVVLDLPSELYTLMTIGVGGYIAGRSGEKIAKTMKGQGDA